MIVKELLKLDRASFLLGDFISWFEARPRKSDIAWASGVLYHMPDPLKLLELLADAADTLFLWTHYIDSIEMPPDDARWKLITSEKRVQWRGHDFVLHERPYRIATIDANFTGGIYPIPHWMEKKDILTALNVLGFDKIEILPGDPNHSIGPNFSIVARRTR